METLIASPMPKNGLEKTETYVQAIERAGIDITATYHDWVVSAFALATHGENGRALFHRVSQFHPKYDYAESDAQFTNCLKTATGKVTLGTFFELSHRAGIRPNFHNGLTIVKKPTPSKPKHPQPVDDEQWLFNVPDVLNAEPQETIWAFITKGVNNALVASSEAGKSTLKLNLCIAVAREDTSFLGWELNAPKGRTIYVATEDGISQLKHKLSKMLGSEAIPDDSILFILEGHDLAKRLEIVLNEKPADLLIIDTYGDLVCGNYEAQSTRGMLGDIKRVCIAHDCTPLFLHHTNKASENIPDKGSIKGAGDFEQSCRVVMMLCIYRDARWLCCVKGNPFSEDLKNTAFELGFDLESQTFSRTGKVLPRAQIADALRKESLGRPATEIDVASLLTERLNHKNLAGQIMNVFGVGLSTAKARINAALASGEIQKDSNGLYYHE